MIRGALAAAVTPLRNGGAALDEQAFGPLVDFLAAGGLDGLLVLGTTGEGIMLSVEERRRGAELFIGAARGRLPVVVHCGAQTTADTVLLSEHAAEVGADAVAVIAPPYFAFDEASLLAHFEAAARGCEPLPFYVYEFEARSGYAVPPPLIGRLRKRAPNLRGLKVSDAPFEKVEPYLLDGLDVFVGREALVPAGIRRGAVGTVSGLATAFPHEVAALVRDPSDERAAEVGAIRASLERFPFHAALKFVLSLKGVPVREDVRAPLRTLTMEERAELERV